MNLLGFENYDDLNTPTTSGLKKRNEEEIAPWIPKHLHFHKMR
jgi:hypothetical protein